MNILIASVGGQGNLLASKILGSVALKKNYDVKVSEVHGMSQRGGSVVTYVKMGEKIYSPIIDEGEADYVLALEQLEAIRYAKYLKKEGTFIINTQKIIPSTVAMGIDTYPDNIVGTLKQQFHNVYAFDALSIALGCGSAKSVNISMIGAFARKSEIDKDLFIEAIKESLPPKILEMNLKAFEISYNLEDLK